MTKRKKFGISPDISQGMTDVVNAVNNNAGSLRYAIVALNRIEEDPNNPRELEVTLLDLQNGINLQDPNLSGKRLEKSELESLAHTIKDKGVINPIIAYKHGEKYRLIAGERRWLASMIAGKTDIPVRILDSKPRDLGIRVLQWVENNERSDLSLRERLKNIQQILEAYKIEKPESKITIATLRELTGLSKAQASAYLSVVNATGDVKEHIQNGNINNLDKASIITNIKNDKIRIAALSACSKGESLKQIKTLISKWENSEKDQAVLPKKNKRGRRAAQIDLGKTKSIKTVKSLLETVLEHPHYKEYSKSFEKVNWESFEGAQDAFKRLINLIARRVKDV